MRILVAIPHYFDHGRDRRRGTGHGSLAGNPAPRVEALTQCISALHQLFGGSQVMIDQIRGDRRPANALLASSRLEVIVCTTRGEHLLDHLHLCRDAVRHWPTDAEPHLLGFACHRALSERQGAFDFYGYLEDDLILRDPLFFAKQTWFQGQFGPGAVLLPNRYEVVRRGPAWKAYIDGDLPPELTTPFQDLAQAPELMARCLDVEVAFHRPLNPHSGCFFLTGEQLGSWAERTDPHKPDTTFVGPLESAATLALMRAFRVYKPARHVAAFLEIEHHGSAYLRQPEREASVTCGTRPVR